MQDQKLLLTGDYPIIASPTLAKAYGVPAATFLQKLHYCLQKSPEAKTNMGKKYWFHTLADWVKTIGIYSVSTIKRSIEKLKAEGIIIVKKLSAKSWLQTNYYTINYQKLEQRFAPQVKESKQTKPKNKPVTPVVQQPTVTLPKAPEPLALVGTAQATIRNATDVEILAMPTEQQQFYKALRQFKVDIAHTDPRITQLLKYQSHVLNLISYLKRDGINKYQWQKPEQLQLDKIIKG